MPRASPIIVIADDLSGAAELAGIAYAHGLTAEVQRRFDPSSNAELIAVDTDSRSLPPHAAADCIRNVVEQVNKVHPAWIYKKVDSVLRGNPRAEIEAALQATGQSQALLIPANPSRGRVIANGNYLINGTPLDQTPLANDVEHPRQSSSIKHLLGNGICSIDVPDVASGDDVLRLAVRVDSSVLPAGAADFFTALLRHRCPAAPRSELAPIAIEPPALLICGSRISWPNRRDECLAAHIPVTTIGELAIPSAANALLLGIGESEPLVDQQAALKSLAEASIHLINALSIETLLAEGGATAAAITRQLNWIRFDVVAAAPAGVGIVRPIAPGSPLLLIKPGSYPWPPEIWQSFCRFDLDPKAPWTSLSAPAAS